MEYNEGDVISVPRHDGSVINLRKTHPEYDPTDRVKALEYVAHHAAKGEVGTGLLYVDPNPEDLHAHFNTSSARRSCVRGRDAGKNKRIASLVVLPKY